MEVCRRPTRPVAALVIDFQMRWENLQTDLAGNISPVRHLVPQRAALLYPEVPVMIDDHPGAVHYFLTARFRAGFGTSFKTKSG